MLTELQRGYYHNNTMVSRGKTVETGEIFVNYHGDNGDEVSSYGIPR